MNYELLYTSAPQGIKPGSRGFCTVLVTRNIPTNLTQKLESISGYRPIYPPGDDREDNNPVCYSHVRFALAGKNVSVISRVSAYGFDYSQRSNKIAHHIAVDERPACGPAALLRSSSVMRTSWDKQCRSLSNGPDLPNLMLDAKLCERWKAVTGDAGWAGYLAANWLQQSAKPVWIVFSEEQSPVLLELMVEATALLPPKARWSATFSTYCTNLPPDADCRVRCVLEGSEEAKLARSRGFVLDLTASMPAADDGPEVNAARAGTMIGADIEEADTEDVPTAPKAKHRTTKSRSRAPAPATETPMTPAPTISAASATASEVRATPAQSPALTLENVPPALLPDRTVPVPPSSKKKGRSRKITYPVWFIPVVLAAGLLLAVGVVSLMVPKAKPQKDIIAEIHDELNIPQNEVERVLASEQPKPAEQMVPEAAQPNEPVAPPGPPQPPAVLVNDANNADRKNISSIEVNEGQLRQQMTLATIQLQSISEASAANHIHVKSSLGNRIQYADGALRWNGTPDFHANERVATIPLIVSYDGVNPPIDKHLTLIIRNENDPDIVLMLKLDQELAQGVVVAGVQLTGVAKDDFDEADQSKRQWVWERLKTEDLPSMDDMSSSDSPADKGVATVSKNENWVSIPNRVSETYIVSLEDYGHKLRCVLRYFDAFSGSHKTVYSRPVQCLPAAVLEYELKDLIGRQTKPITGTLHMDVRLLANQIDGGASWRLNDNKVIPNEGQIQFAFDLESVMPQSTQAVKTWVDDITDKKSTMKKSISELHKFYRDQFRKCGLPLDCDLAHAYLSCTDPEMDPMDLIDQMQSLREFGTSIERYWYLSRQQPTEELDELTKGLIETGNLYPNFKESANDTAKKAQRGVALSKFEAFRSPGKSNFNDKQRAFDLDTRVKVGDLRKALKNPIQLNNDFEHAPRISISLPPTQEGSLEKPKELISFPILLQLKIKPDERYSKFIEEE